MDLVHLALSRDVLRISQAEPGEGRSCGCCGQLPPAGAVASQALCLTCLPAFALDEPGIDSVGQLIWLPTMDQGVLSRLVAGLHTACARTGSTVFDGGAEGAAARQLFHTLRRTQSEAVVRVGTHRLSELRAALRLQRSIERQERRAEESGLRVLMLGTWFDDDPGRYQRAASEWARGR